MIKANLFSVLESLESRMLFSMTPAQMVAADKVKIANDKAQLTADRTNYGQLVSNDRRQLSSDISSALTTAGNAVKADVAQEQQMIQTDQKNGAMTLASDRATIAADRKAISADKGNASAEAADLAKLKSDESVLTADSAALKMTISNDRATFGARIKTDTANLNSIRKGGDTTINADRSTLTTDLKAGASAIATDTKTLAADEVQLLKDEAAELGSNLFGYL